LGVEERTQTFTTPAPMDRFLYPRSGYRLLKRTQRRKMRSGGRGEGIIMGISLGGILVIAGIVLMFVWSFWAGLIVALIGLIVFGGFARDKWY